MIRKSGVLVGKGWERIYIENLGFTIPEKLWYTVTLTFKDGRYKQDISDFMFEMEPNKYDYNPSPYSAEGAVSNH